MINLEYQLNRANEPYYLSPRQRQIAKLLGTGLSLKEAAQKLKMSYNNLKNYTVGIYEILDVQDQLHLILIIHLPLNSPVFARSRYERIK